jgi:hypothetical protein
MIIAIWAIVYGVFRDGQLMALPISIPTILFMFVIHLLKSELGLHPHSPKNLVHYTSIGFILDSL